jgi:hypothetical protein
MFPKHEKGEAGNATVRSVTNPNATLMNYLQVAGTKTKTNFLMGLEVPESD